MTDHTTLVCEHHGSADCLRFQGGEIDIRDGAVAYAELHYYCEHYSRLEGVYRLAEDVTTTHGAILETETRGTPLDEQRGIDQ